MVVAGTDPLPCEENFTAREQTQEIHLEAALFPDMARTDTAYQSPGLYSLDTDSEGPLNLMVLMPELKNISSTSGFQTSLPPHKLKVCLLS